MKWKKKFDTQLYYSVTLLKIKNKVFLPKNFITVLLYLKGKMNNERDLKLQRAQFYCNNLLFALGWNKLDWNLRKDKLHMQHLDWAQVSFCARHKENLIFLQRILWIYSESQRLSRYTKINTEHIFQKNSRWLFGICIFWEIWWKFGSFWRLLLRCSHQWNSTGNLVKIGYSLHSSSFFSLYGNYS